MLVGLFDQVKMINGFQCIAEEARLMSKLASDTKLFKFSNKVRRSVSKLMMYEGPESQSIAAGMLVCSFLYSKRCDLPSLYVCFI